MIFKMSHSKPVHQLIAFTERYSNPDLKIDKAQDSLKDLLYLAVNSNEKLLEIQDVHIHTKAFMKCHNLNDVEFCKLANLSIKEFRAFMSSKLNDEEEELQIVERILILVNNAIDQHTSHLTEDVFRDIQSTEVLVKRVQQICERVTLNDERIFDDCDEVRAKLEHFRTIMQLPQVRISELLEFPQPYLSLFRHNKLG